VRNHLHAHCVRSPLLHHHNLGNTQEFIQERNLSSVLIVASQSCTTISNLRALVRVHIRNKPYSFTLCSNSSSLLASLKLHTRMHTGKKRFSCLGFQKSLSLVISYQEALKNDREIKVYSCSWCSNYFISLHILKCSLREHVYCIFLPKCLDTAPLPRPHLYGQYRPELDYRSLGNFTVPHFQGQYRPLRGCVGSRSQ